MKIQGRGNDIETTVLLQWSKGKLNTKKFKVSDVEHDFNIVFF